MKAAILTEYAGPAGIQIGEIDAPEPGPGEVRVRMQAAALNNSDLQTTRGGYGRPPLPHIIAQEGAGLVDLAGEGVTGFAPGQAVVGRIRRACAELAVAQAAELMALPAGLDPIVAASVPISYLTAAMALVHKGHTRPGSWVMVSPGTGAVGPAAIQLAKLLGASVIATTSSEAKLASLEAWGADHALLWTDPATPAKVRELTGAGVNVFLDGGGKETFAQALEVLASNGRIAIYGYVTGAVAELPITRLLQRNATITGYAIWSNEDYAATLATVRDLVLPAFADGRLRPAIDLILPLERTAEGLQRLADRAAAGKIVIHIA